MCKVQTFSQQMVEEKTSIKPFHIFFWENKSAAAQFDSCSKQIKRHCSVLVFVSIICIQNNNKNLIFIAFFSFSNSCGQFWTKTSQLKLYLHFYPPMYKMTTAPPPPQKKSFELFYQRKNIIIQTKMVF